MCVFPKRCEQPVLWAGFLLANVLNWPWETVHPQMLGSYVRNGSLFCLYVCCYMHAGLRAHVRQAFLCVSPCVCSWWLCARQTAFICININMCLSCSPSHSCPLVQSVQGWPLSSCSGCWWTWSKGRWARWRGQTVRLSIGCVEEKIKVCGPHTYICLDRDCIPFASTFDSTYLPSPCANHGRCWPCGPDFSIPHEWKDLQLSHLGFFFNIKCKFLLIPRWIPTRLPL